jgi:hypothetical protein
MKRIASLARERPVLRILARIEPLGKRAATGEWRAAISLDDGYLKSSPEIEKKGRRWCAAH